jgi:predicted transcriptional regulator
MANILQAAEDGARKTRIMYESNLSFRQLHVYLKYMLNLGLLEAVSQKTEYGVSNVFKVTRKGKAFIEAYLEIKALISE